MMTQSQPRLATALIPLLLAVAACSDRAVERDLADIRNGDTLVVGSRYNSTSYFLYRGAAMGYEYELLRKFAEDHDLTLRMQIADTNEQLLEMLRSGEVDLIAARLVPGGQLEGDAVFTRPLFSTQRVLVQRSGPPDPQTRTQARVLPDPDTLPREVTLRVRRITDPAQLAGESVHVGEESGAYDRLIELSDSIEGDIEVVEVEPDITTEQLIRQVAAGLINFTVSRENIAALQTDRFTNITVRPVIGPPVGLAWAVRPSSPELLAALDTWIATGYDSAEFNEIYTRYYVDRGAYRERAESEYLTGETGRLSDYDALIARNAATIDWDWRLLASQVYQESLFDPRARSWAGAMGLLQLMPATAQDMDVRDPFDPEDNVAGGVRYLKWLEDQWVKDVADPDQRLRFVLASYNTGRGHVQDAQRLAAKNGMNPQRWDHVSYWLLRKSRRDVYTDPVVRFGYSRGLEPVTYVQKILDRFRHYQEFVPPAPDSAAAAGEATG